MAGVAATEESEDRGEASAPLNAIYRRLLPLIVGIFCLSSLLWYATEKLFMQSVGFTPKIIGFATALTASVSLLGEIPLGIAADRWSRKGVMIIACLSIGISTTIGALSHSAHVYIISTTVWGLYVASYSGTVDAVVYDLLLEERGNADQYEQVYGRVKIIEGIAYVLGALTGSLVVHFLTLRATYWLSLPLIATAVVFIAMFREPRLHKKAVAQPLLTHVGRTLSAVARNPHLSLLLPIVLFLMITYDLLFEFHQWWYVSIMMQPYLYGFASAMMYTDSAVAGATASFFRRRGAVVVAALGLIAAFVGLSRFHHWLAIIGSQVLAGIFVNILIIVYMAKVHAHLTSDIRSGASSAISSMSRMILIPGGFLFGFLIDRFTIFQAVWLLIGFATLVLVGSMVLTFKKPQNAAT